MSDSQPKADKVPPPLAFGQLPVAAAVREHPLIFEAMRRYDPVYTTSLAAGLLTEPALQSNCIRLESLAHLALLAGTGRKKPTPAAIATWFDELGAGPFGLAEDPAEDAFSEVISTPHGNYRVLEGIWESATFFLQRVVNIVERGDQTWHELRESVRAALKLSELVCERSRLARYTFGNPASERTLPKEVQRSIVSLRQRVVFNVAELNDHGISLKALHPLVFNPELRDAIPQSSLTHSPLTRYPLLVRSGQLVVALPTALSVAIRSLVVETLAAQGLKMDFLQSLAGEYEEFFRNQSTLGIGFGAPLCFQETDNGVMASVALQIDLGRWLQLILVLDTLEGFEETGFAGANPHPDALAADFDKWRDKCHDTASREQHFRGGLTVIIGCGLGRAAMHRLSAKRRDNWRTVYLSAPDVAILSDLRGSDAKGIWRVLDAQDRLSQNGVELFNLNGLLNLIAWVRSLDGHLVDHSQVPSEWCGGRGRLIIDPTMVLDARRDTATRLDRHAVPRPDGVWTEVRKTGDSLFAEDRESPLYVPTRIEHDEQMPMVYEGTGRHWWCRVTKPREYTRWKLLCTWLPRIAEVLDARLKALPAIISLEVSFDDTTAADEEVESGLSQQAIQADIRVTVDREARSLVIAAGTLFEKGLSKPQNIAESALIGAIVQGCIDLAGDAAGTDPDTLRLAIVNNDRARDCHSFQARTFRDYVGEQLQGDPISIDLIDEATLRLGLGWRVRLPSEGSRIEGKTACNAFLNALVTQLEEEICQELHKFDRRSLVELALRNHELAMVRQATWRRTASAILGLHKDQEAAMTTIAKQEFENNGVLQASRVLVELAVCECPLNDGLLLGEMDLSLLMARLLLLTHLGDWSDAIFFGGMKASINVTPLGDVHFPMAFIDNVVMPFGMLANESMVDSAITGYAENFLLPTVAGATGSRFDQRFVDAWHDEKKTSLDSFRCFVDAVEDLGIERQSPVLTIHRSELLRLHDGDDDTTNMIISSLLTTPRVGWRTTPLNMLDKDRWPWRYRRRLSLLRLPMVQIDEEADPLIVLAPGLLRDAFVYTVRNYHEGYFPRWQINTERMRAWAGTAADRRGKQFSREVAARLKELGWQTEVDVKVSKILAKRLDRDYGDVDVLAWNPALRRILVIECKDLHFHKTAGELAEQLSDFRGEIRNGERDLLRKHLDRIDVLQADARLVGKYTRVASPPVIEGWIVFRNPVPMLCVTEPFGDTIQATTLANLSNL